MFIDNEGILSFWHSFYMATSLEKKPRELYTALRKNVSNKAKRVLAVASPQTPQLLIASFSPLPLGLFKPRRDSLQ